MMEREILQQHTEQLQDHEKRIVKLEVEDARMSTQLSITNKILGSIAGMLCACIVGYFFSLLTK
jgi:hypothetical protein